VGIAKPVIRGMANQRIVSLVDGVKQEGQQWGADHGLELDPFMVGGAKVVKGPGSLRYGSDALGGVIDFSTLVPSGDAEAGLKAEQWYQSNNDQVSTAVTAEARGAEHGLVVHASGQGYGDYRVPADSFTYNTYRLPVAGERLKNTAGREWSAGAAWTTSGISHASRLSIRLYTLDAGLFSGAVGAPRAYLLQDDGDTRDRQVPRQEVTHAAAGLAHRWDGAVWSAALHAGHQWNHRSEYSRAHHHGVAVTGDPSLANDLRLHTSSARAEISRKQGSAGKATLGLSGQAQVNRRGGFEYLLPDYTRMEAGVFGLWEQALGRHVDWSAGARWDLTATETRAHAVSMQDDGTGKPGLVERAPATSRLDGNPSFALGLARRWPEQDMDWSLLLGRSFRVPHPSETVSNGVHHGNFRHELGDTSLRSESGYQADLSFTKSWRGLEVGIHPFAWYFRDYIHLAPGGRFSPLPDAGQVYRYRQHDAVFAGGEMSLAGTWGPLHVSQAWEYLWNLNLDTRLPLPFTPPWSVHHTLEYRRPYSGRIGEWRAWAEWKYVAEQDRVDRNESSTPDGQLFDLGGRLDLRLGKASPSLRVEIRNVLDEEYQGHLSRYRILNLPEPGRSWVVGLVLPLRFHGMEP
jgi:iron complex outermembrane receptor protein